VAALEARLAAAATQTASLEERLARQKDYETVKKDLAILRTLEFSSSQQEEEEGDSSRPLEVLILERSKVGRALAELPPPPPLIPSAQCCGF
jgi:hypothetical protein